MASQLPREDAKTKGWLLDDYPRSFMQTESLEKLQIRPNIYIILNVSELCIDAAVPCDLVIV